MPPLAKQSVPLLMSGMDASSDPRLPRGGPLCVENGRFLLGGIVNKRTGSVGGTTPLDADSLLVPAKAHDVMAVATVYDGIVDVSVKHVAQGDRTAYYYVDAIANSTLAACVYTYKYTASTYGILVETYSLPGGGLIDSLVLVAELSSPKAGKLLKIQTTAHRWRYYYFTEAGELYNGSIDSSGTIYSPAAVSSAAAASTTAAEWDCCALTDQGANGYALIAYPNATAEGIQLLSLPGGDDTGGVCLDISEGAGTVKQPSVWRLTSASVAVAYVLTDTDLYLKAGKYSYDAVQETEPAQIDTVGSDYTSQSTTGIATRLQDNTATSTAFWTVTNEAEALPPVGLRAPCVRFAQYYVSTEAVFVSGWLAARARLATKPYGESTATRPGQCYVGLFTRSWGYALGAQDSLYWVNANMDGGGWYGWRHSRLPLGRPVGKAMLGVARTGDTYGNLSSMQTDGNGAGVAAAMEIVFADNSADQANLLQIGLITLSERLADFGPFKSHQMGDYQVVPCSVALEDCGSTGASGTAICIGAVPVGTLGPERGFLQYPEPIVSSGTTTGTMSPGTYRYRLCYEEIDSRGRRHLSPPSPEDNVITIASPNNAVVLTCPPLTMTRRENVKIAIYRTKAGQSGPYYRVGAVANSPLAESVVFTDTQPDSFIVDMDQLYTEMSGELPNTQPQPHRIAWAGATRYFHVPRNEEDTTVCYSKMFYGGGPIKDCWYYLRFFVDPAGGPITAGCAFGDKQIIFKASRIYAAEGDGYDDVGGGSNYATYLVNPAVGCSDQRCVALTPSGLVFLGGDGNLWLLDHSLQCTVISDPVRYYLQASTPIAVIATPERGLLHVFTQTQGTLVWDWNAKKWSVWTGRTTTEFPDRLLAVSNGGQKLYERDDKGTWAEFSPQPSFGAGGPTFVIGLPDGSIITNDDNDYHHYDPIAETWSTHSQPSAGNKCDAVAISSTSAYVLSETGKIDHWNGTSWSQFKDFGTINMNSIAGDSDSNIWATGGTGGSEQLQYYDGASWTNRYSEMTGQIGAVGVGGIWVIDSVLYMIWRERFIKCVSSTWSSYAAANYSSWARCWGVTGSIWMTTPGNQPTEILYSTGTNTTLQADLSSDVFGIFARTVFGISDQIVAVIGTRSGPTRTSLWETIDGTNWNETTWIDSNVLTALGARKQASISNTGATQAVELDGVTWWLDGSGNLWKEDSTRYDDQNAHYGLAVDTGWLSGGGLGGMARLYWLLVVGDNLASHTLRVQIAYDNDETWVDDETFPSNQLTPYAASKHFAVDLPASYHGQAYVVRMMPSRPDCSAIRVRVSDSVGDTDCWALAYIGLVVGQKPGKGFRVDRNRTVGA